MLTSPSRKSYIGQTCRPIEKRLEEHQKESSNCVAIYRAIQKYGWENFEKDWYEVPDDDLNDHEELMIEVLGTLTPDGYNLKEGGGNGKHSEESKQKMSEAQRGEKSYMFGIPKSEESRRKQSEAQRGEKNHNFGKTPSEDTKQKIRKTKLGEKNHKSKRVYQYSLDGTYIRSFGSAGEAGRHLEKGRSHIIECANGTYKTAYGFKWSYKSNVLHE